jgi:hypothetical protein
MNNDYTTTRIWTRTIKLLRMLHALTGESAVSILHRLIAQELQRVQQEQKPDDPKSL